MSRAALPTYVFPEWMTPANYHLQQLVIPRHTLQYDNTNRNYNPMWRQEIDQHQHRTANNMRNYIPQNRDFPPHNHNLSPSAAPSQPGKRKHTADDSPVYRTTTDTKRVKTSPDQSSNRLTSSVQSDHSKKTDNAKAETVSVSSDNDDDDDDISQDAQLTEEILQYYETHVQMDHHYMQKKELKHRLECVIREIFPGSVLVLVGSSLNGFGCRGSDADLCLLLTPGEVNQKQDARYILQRLNKHFQKRCYFIMKATVIYAKVPIYRFVDKMTGIECDININNLTGIRNTYLLQAYSRVDRRVAPLVMFIKHWAKSNGINDASNGTLSSYTLALLVLHYLQDVCSPPVIPNLQDTHNSIFSINRNIFSLHEELTSRALQPRITFKSKNEDNVGQLFLNFFEHVSKFPFQNKIISIRMASTMKLSGDWRKQFIHIEEPYEKTNVARAIYNQFNFNRVMHLIKDTHEVLKDKHHDGLSLENVSSLRGNKIEGFKRWMRKPKPKKSSKRDRIKAALDFIKRKDKGRNSVINTRFSKK